jgi:hypothetical protein
MRWRTIVADKMWQMEKQQRCGNVQDSWWWRSNEGPDNKDNNTTISKCAAAEVEDDNGW